MVHSEHISVWSLRRTASYRITILRLPDIPASSIEYTFFSDANNSTSWLDHFFCDSTLASLTMSVSPLLYGSNLSDHIPISIVFDICPSSLPVKSPQIPNTHSHSVILQTGPRSIIIILNSFLPPLSLIFLCSPMKFSTVVILIAKFTQLISLSTLHPS